MNDPTLVRTTKLNYPQIYAYVLPKSSAHDGWIKIGYTERPDVDERIREQIRILGISYAKLWSEPAQFTDTKEWFRDTHFHAYLRAKGVEQRPKTEWFYYDGTPEEAHIHLNEFRSGELDQARHRLNYQLRAEQEDAVQTTLAYIQANPGGEFLWNAKPRFGKTLTTYDLARRLNAQNVLIVTNRPAIANSWFDDFEDFIKWQTNYLFVSTTDSLKDRPVITRTRFLKLIDQPEHKDASCIAFISLQDLKGAISFGGTYDKLEWVKQLKWDLLVIDEAHEGVDTVKTEVAFGEIKRNFTLHLSGTPFKAVASGKFSQDQIYNWTYADEQDAKAAWNPANEFNNPYQDLPRLNLFSYQMSLMITEEVNKGAQIDGKDVDFAFDLNEFFKTDASGNFIHEPEVNTWLDTLSRNEKYPFSTPALRNELKHTFWLLERVASAKALEKLLRNHPVFEHYEVIIAAGDGKSDDDDPAVTQKALNRVRHAIQNHDRTITLSVGQLALGVTVPEWSGVLMLSNIQSPSLYMQAAFRAQNPWSYEERGQRRSKQNAYVFDFAPERTLILYDEFANNLSRKTAAGAGTTADREENIRTLLNFFPVIAEDADGKMTALDVRQVLTIPRFIKAREVVRRGFMSNLLFQNIHRIFSSPEIREILDHLTPVAPGKPTLQPKQTPLEIPDIQVDAEGNATVPNAIVIAAAQANFGEKIYKSTAAAVQQAVEKGAPNLPAIAATAFTRHTLDAAKEIAKDSGVTAAQAEQAVRQTANAIAREIEVEQRKANILVAEAQTALDKIVAKPQQNPEAIAAAKAKFEAAKHEIEQKLTQKAAAIVANTQHTAGITQTILQKGEEKKKQLPEDDVRARLRGFARTIPSFLMAYGTPDTTLENFDANLDDAVFKDVTGITLDQFRTLRDKYHFFDPVVFNEAILEFLRKKEELADYFSDAQTEDIFDYIPPQETNQVFTPKKVVRQMVDYLEAENPRIFSNQNAKFADLYVKSGLFLAEIAKRLFSGLQKTIPDPKKRLQHIFQNQIYGFAPTPIIFNIAKNFLYGNLKNIPKNNLKCQDLTEIARNNEEINMKFDVVVGNPPYQEEAVGTSTKDLPIYPYFYDLAEHTAQKYCLISPARFLFNAGGTNKAWNAKMLDDENLKIKLYAKDSSEVFVNTNIMGGVVVIYRDAEKIFGRIGTFTGELTLDSLVAKIPSARGASLDEIVSNRGQYRFSDEIYKDFPKEMRRITDRRISTNAFDNLPDLFTDKKPNDGAEYVQIYGRVGVDRGYKWFKSEYLTAPPSFGQFKVFISKANGAALKNGTIVGLPFVAGKQIGSTETFLTIGGFKTKLEAENLAKYIKTKFVRILVSVLKVTPDNTKEKWEKVPLQDFTNKSDIDWSQPIPEIDRQLYKKYGLTKQEIAFIEEKIAPMD